MIPTVVKDDDVKDGAWGAPLNHMKLEFVLPRTLAQAVNIPNTIVMQRDEIKKDLQDLKDWAEDCYSLIATFSDVNHAQGLAMHKIATISNKISQLQKKYE